MYITFGYFVIFNETSWLLNPWFLDERNNFNKLLLVSVMTINYNVSAMMTNYNNKLACDDDKLQLIIIDDIHQRWHEWDQGYYVFHTLVTKSNKIVRNIWKSLNKYFKESYQGMARLRPVTEYTEGKSLVLFL